MYLRNKPINSAQLKKMSSFSNKSSERNVKHFRSAFKQQQLPAWQPILTARSVLSTFFCIGIVCIPVGIGLLFLSNNVKEIEVDYTFCMNSENVQCNDIISRDRFAHCNCNLIFKLETDFLGKVYMYYGLVNFYQNHRRYAKSYDSKQLLGKLYNKVSSRCKPFDKTSEGKIIVPCGAIANSLFNDEFSLEFIGQWKSIPVPLLRTGIAWPSDKTIKFHNPPGNLSEALKSFAKPKLWKKNLWELDLHDPGNNGFKNEDLIVWMRVSAFPNFRKLYRRIDHSKDGFFDGLPKGNYILFVNYSFFVTSFNGRKKMILTTGSLLGAKNPFLGMAYIIVGCVSLVLAVLFLFIHIKFGRTASENADVDYSTTYCAFFAKPNNLKE